MPFEPGQSGNPQGKPKGAKSVKTKQWELLADAILNEHTERFNEVLSQLEGKEFVDAYLKVLSYLKPRMKSVEERKTDDNKIFITYFKEPPEGIERNENTKVIDFRNAE